MSTIEIKSNTPQLLAKFLERARVVRDTLRSEPSEDARLELRTIYSLTIGQLRSDAGIFEAVKKMMDGEVGLSQTADSTELFRNYRAEVEAVSVKIRTSIFPNATVHDPKRLSTLIELAEILRSVSKTQALICRALGSPWYVIYMPELLAHVHFSRVSTMLRGALGVLSVLEIGSPDKHHFDLETFPILPNSRRRQIRLPQDILPLVSRLLGFPIEKLDLTDCRLHGNFIPIVLTAGNGDPIHLLESVCPSQVTIPVDDGWRAILNTFGRDDLEARSAGQTALPRQGLETGPRESLELASEIKIGFDGQVDKRRTYTFTGAGLNGTLKATFNIEPANALQIDICSEARLKPLTDAVLQLRKSSQDRHQIWITDPGESTPSVGSYHDAYITTRDNRPRVMVSAGCLLSVLTGECNRLYYLPTKAELMTMLQAGIKLALPPRGRHFQQALMKSLGEVALASQAIQYWPSISPGRFNVGNFPREMLFCINNRETLPKPAGKKPRMIRIRRKAAPESGEIAQFVRSLQFTLDEVDSLVKDMIGRTAELIALPKQGSLASAYQSHIAALDQLNAGFDLASENMLKSHVNGGKNDAEDSESDDE